MPRGSKKGRVLPTRSLRERFEDKYTPEPNTGCWLWTAYCRTDGYGEINRGRQGEGTALAHRVSYEIHVGEIPEDLEIDHLCRVRSCVNPSHLEPVTRYVNIMRGDNPGVQVKRAQATTHCPQGHEYTTENTHIARTARGYTNRMCRTCQRERMRARRAEKRAATC